MTVQEALDLIDTDESENSDSDADAEFYTESDNEEEEPARPRSRPSDAGFTVETENIFTDWTDNLANYPTIPDFTGVAGLTLPPNTTTPLQLTV